MKNCPWESRRQRRRRCGIPDLAHGGDGAFHLQERYFSQKEEIPLPSSYPNIYQILWSNVSLRDVEFKPQEEKLAVQGDIQVFVLYEAEGGGAVYSFL